jgi:hypothetical protein
VGYALWALADGEIEAASAAVATSSGESVLWLRPLLAIGGLSAANLDAWRAAAMLAGALALLGWRTPIALPAFAALNLVVQGFLASQGRFDHIHGILAIALALLALTPAGAELSLDACRDLGRWASLRTRTRAAALPTAAIGGVLALAYASAGASKAVGSALEWCNGSTLQFYAFFKGVPHGAPLAEWLSREHAIAQGLSWCALAFELSFGLCVLFPRLRWVYLPAGVAFHVFAHLAVGAAFYSFVAVYACLVPWSALFARLSWPHAAR